MEFSVKPLSVALGAEIRGLDFSHPFDGETIAGIQEAWLKHLVLVFRCGPISEDDQARFATHFGETVGARSAERKDGARKRQRNARDWACVCTCWTRAVCSSG